MPLPAAGCLTSGIAAKRTPGPRRSGGLGGPPSSFLRASAAGRLFFASRTRMLLDRRPNIDSPRTGATSVALDADICECWAERATVGGADGRGAGGGGEGGSTISFGGNSTVAAFAETVGG